VLLFANETPSVWAAALCPAGNFRNDWAIMILQCSGDEAVACHAHHTGEFMRTVIISGVILRYVVTSVLALLLPVEVYGNPADDAWLDTNEEAQTADVNEGALTFLDQPPNEAVHSHHNRITLDRLSLEDGWAALYQCHTGLDPVPAAQVVFRPGRMRHLKVERASGIGRAWVEGPSVQLEDVEPGASLCLSGETQIVFPQPGGGFLVRNGPFMRRFLDGYYPMHVRLEIELPPGDWELVDNRPTGQKGFAVTRTPQGLDVDAWFEGELRTEFHFVPAGGGNRMNHETGEQE
jgi:hypothetical protein